MRIIADLHIHSKYSRAVSKSMDIDTISAWAKIKGIDLMATGDWTHPKWLEEIKLKLKEDGSGILTSRDKYKQKFILSTETSHIYGFAGKVRKIHLVTLAPDIKTVSKINTALGKIGNLHSDGRPILGLPVQDYCKLVWDINSDCMIIPAHAWTPWFSIFGSKSGFDSIEECFGEYSNRIFAIETGLSSDPEMNWRLSALDNITLISNSDAHSKENLGREANVFEIKKITYDTICEQIKNKKLKATLEFYPEEGMYHFDGHSNCKLIINPFEKKYEDERCPLCRKKMTIGVANRVESLANRKAPKQLKNFPDSIHLVQLQHILAAHFEVGKNSKRVAKAYHEIIERFGNEFNILLDTNIKDLKKYDERIAQGIANMRAGNLTIDPGYDGVYGKVHIFKDEDLGQKLQKTLF